MTWNRLDYLSFPQVHICEDCDNSSRDGLPLLSLTIFCLHFTELNYLSCKTLLDLLSGQEAYNAKNLIGQYQNSAMKDLNDVVKQYEKENIYLGIQHLITWVFYKVLWMVVTLSLAFAIAAELAQMLYRKISYEIPFIKKEMSKLDQSNAEYSRRTAECLKSGGDFREQYRQECVTLGIQV